MTEWLLICGKNALEMAEKCIFQTHATKREPWLNDSLSINYCEF